MYKQIFKNLIDNYLLVYLDKILKRPNIINGLREVSFNKIIKDGDFIFGELGVTNARIIKEDGNFEKYLPEGEQQNIDFEKMWCVSENGICNQIETDFNYFIDLEKQGKADDIIKELLKIFRYFELIKGDKCLLDTAYVASGSGTTRRGNNYKQVSDFIRHYGLVPKGSYPSYKTWNDLYYPAEGVWANGNKVPKELVNKGKKLVEFIDITYEWVYSYDFNKAARDGVIGTSCYAWGGINSKGIYISVNTSANHAILKPKKDDLNWKMIFDSYIPFKKNLELNYRLGTGMMLSFGVKKPFNIFNEKAINEFKKKRGVDYLLLVESMGKFTPGLYEILDGKFEKKELPQAVNEWIRGLAKEGKLIGINAKDFSQFIT